MTAGEALDAIHTYATQRRIVLSRHARERMQSTYETGGRGGTSGGLTLEEIRLALMHATNCRPAVSARWKVDGKDLDGDDLTFVVSLDDQLIVVTIM